VKAVLGVFLKAPRPGAVKTRLIPALGPAAAAGLYRALAEDVVGRTTPRPGDYERVLFFTPNESRAEIEGWFSGETCTAQEEGDLGARMSAAFDEAFRGGADRVAVVGSDVPGLGRDDVLAALASLEDHDLVLGPARDGGYYLIALSRARPELFRAIVWGTSAVFGATMERAFALGLTVRLLDERRDIDTLEDIRAEWPRIRPLLPGPLADAIAMAVGEP
jgi:rSAM/selenodomain-associated transferase 1